MELFYVNNLVYRNYEIEYYGFVYIPAVGIQDDAIRYIIDELITCEKFYKINSVYGVYFIKIINIKDNVEISFNDNSGLFNAFIYKNEIDTSFLKLVKDNKEDIHLDFEKIVEFLHFGMIYFDGTIIKEISKIDYSVFYFIENDVIEKVSKNIPLISEKSDKQIFDVVSDLQNFIKSENISIDLTGGYDSRLIVSVFESLSIDFETAISGVSENKDLIIPKKISEILKKDFFPTIHNVENINKDDLIRLLEITDGQIDILNYHRLDQLMSDRKSRNVTFHFSGAGGELYKDFWWLQDFPFYNTKPNLNRLYDYRIESTSFIHNIFHKNLQNISNSLKENLLNKLIPFCNNSNTETYDLIYYYYKMQTMAGNYLSISNKYFLSYAPLLELDLIRYGYSIPKKKRVFNNYHKDVISKYCKPISFVKTNTGVSCSNLLRRKFIDTFLYCFLILKKIIKQIARKITGQTIFYESPNNKRLYKKIADSEILIESINNLKNNKILCEELEPNYIDPQLYGRIITLDLILQIIS